VLRIINEPTAASLAYGLDKRKDETIAVYDLAAARSTFPSWSWERACSRMKSTNGDTFLGGDDFDERVINWLADSFLKDSEIDLRKEQEWRSSGSRRRGEG